MDCGILQPILDPCTEQLCFTDIDLAAKSRRYKEPKNLLDRHLLHRGISIRPMSALGQERTSPVTEPMSALPLKADIATSPSQPVAARSADVRFRTATIPRASIELQGRSVFIVIHAREVISEINASCPAKKNSSKA
jgi:hypothetical protein